jgi:alanyl-tRNA synthetase
VAAARLLTLRKTLSDIPVIIAEVQDVTGEALQDIADALKGHFEGVVFLVSAHAGAVSLVSTVSSSFTSRFAAGKLVQTAAPIVDGKGGGRPDTARGAGKKPAAIPLALESIAQLISG